MIKSVIFAIFAWLMLTASASAQNVICTTAAPGTSDNRCASTAFVQTAVTGGGAFTLPQNKIFVGNASNVATAVTMSGDCTIVSSGAITCASSGGLTVGTSTIASGTNGYILYNNSGVLGNKQPTGTGLAVLQTSPSIASPTLTGTVAGTNVIPLTVLAQSGAATLVGNATAGTANLTAFTVQGLTDITTPNTTLDFIPIYNHTTGTIQRTTAAQLQTAVGGGVTSLGGLTGSVTCGTNITCSAGSISASFTAVTSLGGLTGSVTCGTGITCSAGTISASGGSGGITIGTTTITSGTTTRVLYNNGGLVGEYTTAQLAALTGPTIYNVVCDVTGTSDCSSAINAQITAAITALGGLVQLPCGIILVNSGISIASGITLQGCGYEDYATNQVSDTPGIRGTYLYQTSGSNPAITIGSSANGVVIRKMACRQLQPADTGGWTPTAYQPCIQALGNTNGVGASLVEDFGCMGVYKCYNSGDWFSGQQRSRNRLNRVQADCYNLCFRIGFSADTDRITDVHIWPFTNLNNANILTYQRGNTIGFYLDRQDNGEYINIYVFGAARGMFMSSCGASCSVNSLEIVNFNCDACVYGIHDTSERVPGFMMKLANIAFQSAYDGGAGTWGSSLGLVTSGAYARYQITNLSTTFMGLQAISISGANSDVAITNWNTYYWNMAAAGAAGINCAATTICTITGRWLMEAGGAGALTSGTGTFQTSHAN